MFDNLKTFNTFANEALIKKNEHKDVDPYGEEDWRDSSSLIKKIKFIVEKYGSYITMSDLQAESSPHYTEDVNGIHLIESLSIEDVAVVVHGGYKYEYEIDEYNVSYEDLEIDTLEEIKWLLENAIENELLEEDI